ncbi:MAG TPA: oligosaccharide flippase family protein, partial [Salinimicrobium sp.]|nr:oligosaccharide flippase family protein [Salinimicrobium sp.]
MGIIINQSAKNLFTTYLGFGIGAINTLFLYTNFLEPRYYGLVSFLLSAANLIWPLMAFGVQNTLVKFFSSYDTKTERDKLLSMVLLLPLIVAIVLGSIGFLSYGWILDYFSDQNTLVRPYVWLIFVVAVATAYFEVFFAWAKIHYRSVFGNFLKEVFHRVCIALLLLLVFAGFLSVSEFIYTLAGVYLLRAIIMAFYAFRLYIPEFLFSFPRNKWPVLKYSALI